MQRGEIWRADLSPTRGSEQYGARPVLIIQDSRLTRFLRSVVGLPFTGNVGMADHPACVFVPAGAGGLRKDSVALCHQLRVMDKSRLMERWGTLPAQQMREIEQIVRYTLGF